MMVDGSWDEVVASANGHIYQTSHWMRAMQQRGAVPVPFRLGNDCVMMAYLDSKFSARRIGIRLNQLIVTHGPVFRDAKPRLDSFIEIILKLDEYAKLNGVAYSVINISCFPPTNYLAKDILRRMGYSRVPDKQTTFHTQTYIVDLEASEEDILKRMEKRTRWSIRKAEESGVTVENQTDEDSLGAFYKLFKDSNPNPAPPQYFRNIIKSLGKKGMAKIFLAKIGDRPVSGALLLMFGRTVFYKWGASNHGTNKLGAGEFLHWRAMQWAKQSGYTRYDLHGAVIGEDVGATLFKRGFGGAPVKYLGEYRKAYSRLLGFRELSLLQRMRETVLTIKGYVNSWERTGSNPVTRSSSVTSRSSSKRLRRLISSSASAE